jgi:hypothetical protein
MFFDIGTQFGNLYQGLFAILSIDKYRTPMSKVVGYTGDALSQLHFTHKLGVMLAHKPYYRRDVVHALVVQYDYGGPIRSDMMWVIEGIPGTKDMGASH